MKVTFLGALCLLFIGLKLGGVIGWSWWYVMAPILWPLYIVMACFAFACVVAIFKRG